MGSQGYGVNEALCPFRRSLSWAKETGDRRVPASKHVSQTMVVVEGRLHSSQLVSLWFSFGAEAATGK